MDQHTRTWPGTPGRAFILAGLLALAVAACGGSAGGAGADPASTPGTTHVAAGGGADAGSGASGSGGSTGENGAVSAVENLLGDIADDDGGIDLSAITPVARVEALLGELPVPDCEHRVVFRGDACRWTAADGESYVKIERSESREMSTLETFTAWVNDRNGLRTPVPGVGEAAFYRDNPLGHGVTMAAYVGDGVHMWVVLAVDGDEADLLEQAKAIALEVIPKL